MSFKTVILKDVALTYPKLINPSSFKINDPKFYSATLYLHEDSEAWGVLKKAWKDYLIEEGIATARNANNVIEALLSNNYSAIKSTDFLKESSTSPNPPKLPENSIRVKLKTSDKSENGLGLRRVIINEKGEKEILVVSRAAERRNIDDGGKSVFENKFLGLVQITLSLQPANPGCLTLSMLNVVFFEARQATEIMMTPEEKETADVELQEELLAAGCYSDTKAKNPKTAKVIKKTIPQKIPRPVKLAVNEIEEYDEEEDEDQIAF